MRSGPEEQGRAGQGKAMQLASSWWAQQASPALALGTRGGVPSWERERAGQGQERKSALACVVSGVLASSSEWRNPHSPGPRFPFLLTFLQYLP